MKNAEAVAKASKDGTKLYYSIREKAVYTEAGAGRHYVTTLIRKNSAEEIQEVVKRFLAM